MKSCVANSPPKRPRNSQLIIPIAREFLRKTRGLEYSPPLYELCATSHAVGYQPNERLILSSSYKSLGSSWRKRVGCSIIPPGPGREATLG